MSQSVESIVLVSCVMNGMNNSYCFANNSNVVVVGSPKIFNPYFLFQHSCKHLQDNYPYYPMCTQCKKDTTN